MTDMTDTTITSYKGFDQNLQCRGFQYQLNQTYTHEGPVQVCESGFHACEYPLDVFGYYPPASGRYFQVAQSGDLSREDTDSKIASRTLTLNAELTLADIVTHAVNYVFDRSTPEGAASATGDHGAASATGNYGAASATGDHGAASATGYQSAASAAGDQGAASATGDHGAASATGNNGAASATGNHGAASATGNYGAASATGYQGAASATGNYGAASATGYQGKAKGALGNALFLLHRDDDYNITHVWAGIIGQNGILPDTWYRLNDRGEPCAVAE